MSTLFQRSPTDRAAGARSARICLPSALTMLKESHFTPQRMLNMLGLKPDSLGPYALVPGPKERSDLLLKLLASPQKSFTFLDYEMHTGALDGKRVSVGNGGRYAPDTAITTEILCGSRGE